MNLCGRIFIKVKDPSDWKKLDDLPIKKGWCLGDHVVTGKDIWGGINVTGWCIDGDWSPQFRRGIRGSDGGLSDMVYDIVGRIGQDRCMVIADLVDINCDGGYEVYYSLGYNNWYEHVVSYYTDQPDIRDVQKWLKWANIKVTANIAKFLHQFGEKFYTSNVHDRDSWLYISVKDKSIWDKLAKVDLTDTGYSIEGNTAELFSSQGSYDMELRGFDVAYGSEKDDIPLLRLVQTLTKAAGEGNLFVLSYCSDPVVSPVCSRCVYVINGEVKTSEAVNDMKKVSKNDIAGSIRKMGTIVNSKVLNYAAGFPSEKMDFARKKLGLPCGADINVEPDSELVIPDGTEYIKKNAYKGKEYLRSVVIPDSVTTIGEQAFAECRNLEKVVLPAGLRSIERSAFSKCDNLKQLFLPDRVNSIGENAFTSCKALKDVKLNDGLKIIGENAFKYCWSLESIEIPDSVEYIGGSAFKSRKKLKKINMPVSLKNIDAYVFENCKNLSDFIVPKQISPKRVNAIFFGGTTLKGKSNYEIYIGNTLVLADKEEVIVREGTEEITLYSLHNVKKLVLLSPLRRSWSYASYICDRNCLEELVLPDGLQKIEKYNISGLSLSYGPFKRLTIPASVTEIDETEFADIKNITICGSKGTLAEEIAKKYGYDFEEIK